MDWLFYSLFISWMFTVLIICLVELKEQHKLYEIKFQFIKMRFIDKNVLHWMMFYLHFVHFKDFKWLATSLNRIISSRLLDLSWNFCISSLYDFRQHSCAVVDFRQRHIFFFLVYWPSLAVWFEDEKSTASLSRIANEKFHWFLAYGTLSQYFHKIRTVLSNCFYL